MSIFQRRHYEAIVEMLGSKFFLVDVDLINALCEGFTADNPNFNETRFRQAINDRCEAFP